MPGNYYELMAEYNRWMDGRIYDACSLIPDEDRKKDMGAFFKSIHGTLNHIYYGDAAWLERLRGNKSTPRKPDVILFDDFSEMRAAQEKIDAEIIEWAESLTPEYLNGDYEYKSNVDGKTRVLPGWIPAAHMFNHQTHHRGQLTTLLMQLGIDPGVTDIPWL
ncbi:MAG TPA: DinB family protein, partial [Thermodesulfobacteriota bacterium]|nr:DinB family protein [Thermodesulfobacteriota bacterium]